ncbi:MAG: ABC transporter ATP-binding protein [FCB group bacterium]|jgi:iron complex transport system ATP-binding protein|nr:ABC transporter ATP-binding protein [FCB group bacterium]
MASAIAPPVLNLNGVTFRRNDREILSDVSWRIEPGEHWALLGANGSGKTTLLKVINGYEWATRGTVEVLGRRFGSCNVPQLRKSIGWVSSALQQRLPLGDTALRIVDSGYEASLGVYRTFTEEEIDRAKAALALVSGASIADRIYGTLSQGEQQRVLIARALVNGPRLLILDEPCAGLDPVAARQFLDDLSALAARPEAPTVIFVTHHIQEIAPWIERVLLLKSGRVSARGETAKVLTGPNLSAALDSNCRVDFDGAHYWLRLQPQTTRQAAVEGA